MVSGAVRLYSGGTAECVHQAHGVLVVVVFYGGGSVKLIQQPVLENPAEFKITFVGRVNRFYLADKRFYL